MEKGKPEEVLCHLLEKGVSWGREATPGGLYRVGG